MSIRGVKLADSSRGDSCTDLEILVGIDNFFKFVYAQPGTDELFIIPSKVGNILSGNVACGSREQVALSTILKLGSCETADSTTFSDAMTKFWDLDHVAIKDRDVEETSVMKTFERSVSYVKGRYRVALLWKESQSYMETNFSITYKRFTNTLEKLRADPDTLKQYHEVILKQLKSGFIEPVYLN